MYKLTIVLTALLATACLAQAPATAPAAAQPQQQLSASIDTWIEGTVLSLDADGQKFSVRGVKLPFATAEAGMMKDIAEKTKNLDATQREQKTAEIRQSWADKLNKAKSEPVKQGTSDFNFSLPDKANLVILDDTQIMREGQQESLNAAVSTQSSASVNTEQSKLAGSAGTEAPKGDVAQPAADKAEGEKAAATVTARADQYDRKELGAIRTLKDLKVGDKVRVGYDAGLLSNTAYVIVNDKETAIR